MEHTKDSFHNLLNRYTDTGENQQAMTGVQQAEQDQIVVVQKEEESKRKISKPTYLNDYIWGAFMAQQAILGDIIGKQGTNINNLIL